MGAESMEEYVLAYAEADYENLEEQAPMGFIASGGEFLDGITSHWSYLLR